MANTLVSITKGTRCEAELFGQLLLRFKPKARIKTHSVYTHIPNTNTENVFWGPGSMLPSLYRSSE